ncbi:MAG: GGDEF domain-containing protein [Planctomycetaceae bacterium]|nr:GGDEF domain-containing protein [Planctomycetaceae bacterium]
MNQPTQKVEVISLAETNASGFDLNCMQEPDMPRGCLLQIYPARPDVHMIRIHQRRTILGRDLHCQIAIEDSAASRHHAAIIFEDAGYLIQDLNSTNGTYVNDARISGSLALKGGELIRLGGTIFKFLSSFDQEAQYHTVVQDLMVRDSLTNAFNRSYLIPTLQSLLKKCQSSDARVAMIMMDIDLFKAINDKHGHLVGDEVLRVFCERVRDQLRPEDFLARWGGEEFIVIAKQVTLKEARRIAERIRLAISSTSFQTQSGPITVTCSLGIACANGKTSYSVDQFIGIADHWLYVAKKSGRNNVQSTDP